MNKEVYKYANIFAYDAYDILSRVKISLNHEFGQLENVVSKKKMRFKFSVRIALRRAAPIDRHFRQLYLSNMWFVKVLGHFCSKKRSFFLKFLQWPNLLKSASYLRFLLLKSELYSGYGEFI